MNQLSEESSASLFIHDVNENLDELNTEVTLSLSDSASTVCTKLNSVFSGFAGNRQLSPSDSATQFIYDLNYNFALASAPSGGGDEPEPEQPVNNIVFMHVTDPHGDTSALAEAKSLINNDSVDFVAVSGDLAYNGSTATVDWLNNTSNDFSNRYLIQGNHDVEYGKALASNANSADAVGKYLLRDKFASWMNNDVTFGNTTSDNVTVNGESAQKSKGLYWHKKFQVSSSSDLYLIGLDDYDLASETYAANTGAFSKDQATWLVNLLASLRDSDYFILMLHEPPVPKTSYVILHRRTNPWCSSRAKELIDYSAQASSTPALVHQYLNGGSGSVSGYSYTFDGTSHATFLGYLCGHCHCDYITYGNYVVGSTAYQNQLVMALDTSYTTKPLGGISDLTSTSTSNPTPKEYETFSANTLRPGVGPRNKVTLDFNNSRIIVERVGLACAAHHRVLGSSYKNGDTARDTFSGTDDSHLKYASYSQSNSVYIVTCYMYDLGIVHINTSSLKSAGMTIPSELVSPCPKFVKNGGVWGVEDLSGSSYSVSWNYQATNADGSTNDDVEYVGFSNNAEFVHVTYEYVNNTVVANVRNNNGDLITTCACQNGDALTPSGFSIPSGYENFFIASGTGYKLNHLNLYLKRKKISFPFVKQA